MKNNPFVILLVLLVSLSCRLEPPIQYSYQVPENIHDGLEMGDLSEVNMDKQPLENAGFRIVNGRFKEVHAMLIVKDGKLVFEDYFRGHQYQWDAPYHHGELISWDRESLHTIMSDTKSITSACIGIAIDHGFINSVKQSIFDYLPEHQHLKTGGKENITIEHLLTMTSGLDWREWSAPYSSVENPCISIWFQDKDPISFILDRPLVAEPGTRFNYATGNMVVLGEILRNATGLSIDDFSNKYLFHPLDIDSFSWHLKYENGVDANNLELTPRAMVKIGITFLNQGRWKGKQIISSDWIAKSVTPYPGNESINIPEEDSGRVGYAYSWWIKEYTIKDHEINMFYASGWGGQHIIVIPEYNMVVVFTGGNYVTKRPPFKILKKYIFSAMM